MKWLLSLLAGLTISASAAVEDIGPDVMVKNVTNEVIEIVRRDKDIQSGNTRKAVDLVETKVLPHFNFQRMTAQAVGKSWRQASAAQQKSLSEAFIEETERFFDSIHHRAWAADEERIDVARFDQS